MIGMERNKKADNIDELKEAVREALKQGCEVCDENGDIVFSQWDGWKMTYEEYQKCDCSQCKKKNAYTDKHLEDFRNAMAD